METVTRVYDSYPQARQVVSDLEAFGIAASDVDLIANSYVCDEAARRDQRSGAGPGAGIGATLGGATGLLAGLGMMAIPGLGPVVAVGALAATAVGAAAGAVAGGLLGALVQAGVPEDEAHVYCEAVKRGGTLVSVRTDAGKIAAVQRLMAGHRPIDPIERRSAYVREGWSRFEDAPTR